MAKKSSKSEINKIEKKLQGVKDGKWSMSAQDTLKLETRLQELKGLL